MRQGTGKTYRIVSSGAKYAYRVPKVLTGYTYEVSKQAAMEVLLRMKGTHTYRILSRSYQVGQQATGLVKGTFQIGRAGALRAYRMATAPFKFASKLVGESAKMAIRAMMQLARMIATKIVMAVFRRQVS